MEPFFKETKGVKTCNWRLLVSSQGLGGEGGVINQECFPINTRSLMGSEKVCACNLTLSQRPRPQVHLLCIIPIQNTVTKIKTL